MATFQVVVPDSFDVHCPDDWPKWIRRFERFRQASGLVHKAEEKQVNALIYTMGDVADDILSLFGLTEDDKKVYETVKEKFDSYFVKRRNVIFERAKFNRRCQKQDESVDSFITALHGLAEKCNFGTLREELIRDRLVVGLSDSTLSEKLQLDAELTLEKATTAAREKEAVKKQQAMMRKDFQEESHVDTVSNRSKSKPRGQPRQNRVIQCRRCGRDYQGQHRCPAIHATCHNCHRKGHYRAICQSGTSKVKEIQAEPDSDSEETASVNAAFLGIVHDKSQDVQPWMISVSLNDVPMKFKMDTGADVSVIPLSSFRSLGNAVRLKAPNRVLCGPGRIVLPVIGYFSGYLKYKDRVTKESIYIVEHLQTPLLGRQAITRLQLIQRLDDVEEQSPAGVDPVKEFPSLFCGLGKLGGEHTIQLKENATPYTLSTPRRVAIPLMPKVKKELERMERLGVISPVTEPTDWCAGLVVVPKSGDQVRICVDMTKLNENVRRERHILPSVEQTLGLLGGAQYFSKLDANSGFWQIPLDHASSLLTTFITPFGRFRFNRLPFGITSAPEHFQRRMSTIMSGLSGVVCHTDDVLVYGRSREEHDQNLRNALKRIEKAGLTLNKDKCKFSQQQVKFLGQVIDGSGVSPDPTKIQAILEFKRPTDVPEL